MHSSKFYKPDECIFSEFLKMDKQFRIVFLFSLLLSCFLIRNGKPKGTSLSQLTFNAYFSRMFFNNF